MFAMKRGLAIFIAAAIALWQTPDSMGAEPGAIISVEKKAEDAIVDRSRAEKTIKFYNASIPRLKNGYYSQAAKIAESARRYEEVWKLPKRKAVGARKSARRELEPPKGIFNEAEEKDLTSALDDMDKALATMLEKFAKLEAYVADDKIIDDGKEGARLVKDIRGDNAKFVNARKKWLGIVENRANEAEDFLARGHPLERQLIDARKIRSAMEEIREITLSGGKDLARVKELAYLARALAKDAAAPPFPASPGLERLYRTFLKKFSAFEQILDRGIREGFGQTQRREILKSASECGEAYNKFAGAVNSG